MNLLKELISLPLTEEVELSGSTKANANRIAQKLFGKDAGPVVDKKRSKDPIFFGVDHEKSYVRDSNGKKLNLTFDNSTDSGEFEINSLTPLDIVKDSDLDKEIRSLYKKHKIESKKRTNYISKGDKLVMREIHLGSILTSDTIKMINDLLGLLHVEKEKEEVKEETQLTEADGSGSVFEVRKAIYRIDYSGNLQWIAIKTSDGKVDLYLQPTMILVRQFGENFMCLIPDSLAKPKEVKFTKAEIKKLLDQKYIKQLN